MRGLSPLQETVGRSVVESHPLDGALDPLTLVRVCREETAPVKDDLVHRLLLARLLARLVVVGTHDQRHSQVEHGVAVLTQCEHAEEEVDVLHAADRVTPGVEPTHERTERLDPDQHPSVTRVPVRSSQGDDVPILSPLERGADHADLGVIDRGVEHGLEVLSRELRLDADVHDEAETIPLPYVRHEHGFETDVQGVRPRVALVHLDELHVAGFDEPSEEASGSASVLGGVRNDDDLTDPRVTQA